MNDLQKQETINSLKEILKMQIADEDSPTAVYEILSEFAAKEIVRNERKYPEVPEEIYDDANHGFFNHTMDKIRHERIYAEYGQDCVILTPIEETEKPKH